MNLKHLLHRVTSDAGSPSVEQQLDKITDALESAVNDDTPAELPSGNFEGAIARLADGARAAMTSLHSLKARPADQKAQISAINRAMFVIEFELDGTVRTANDNFLTSMCYSLVEVQGKHHRMFVDPEDVDTPEYDKLWFNLRAGKFRSAVFRRRTKFGEPVWIRASYVPIKNEFGEPYKVVKYAMDITELMQELGER